MFKYAILEQEYTGINELLSAIADNVVYAYGVVDDIAAESLNQFTTKKTSEQAAVDTAVTSTPVLGYYSDMTLEGGYVMMVTGLAGGEPALAYVSDGWPRFSAVIANNLDMLATALGYAEWFIAPQMHQAQTFFGGKFPHVALTTLAVGETTLNATTVDAQQPILVVECPTDPPHDVTAVWTAPADIDAYIDYLRAHPNFKFIRRGSNAGYQHIYPALRHYITDLENTQDVLRQVTDANSVIAAEISASLEDEASDRTAADRALAGAIDTITVFGTSFKNIVEKGKVIDEYIPRP